VQGWAPTCGKTTRRHPDLSNRLTTLASVDAVGVVICPRCAPRAASVDEELIDFLI